MPGVLSIVSVQRILELPWFVGYPGLAVIALLLWSALMSILRLRLGSAIGSLVLAFAVAVILSQAGFAIAQLIGSG